MKKFILVSIILIALASLSFNVAYAAELGAGGGSDYPGTLDADSTLETTSTVARADVPNDLGAAIVAIQTELGTDPAGTLTDVKTFVQTEHATDGTHGAITATTLTTTGNVTLGDAAADTVHFNANVITFEGATADDFELTLGIEDPTIDSTFDIGNTRIIMEGATADAFEFTLQVTDPTADVMLTTDPAQNMDLREQLVKGWIHFNGSGTPAIDDSFNVTGTITDNQTGDYSFTWDTDFATVSYAVGGFCHLDVTQCFLSGNDTSAALSFLTTGMRVMTIDAGGSRRDATSISVMAIGDR